MTVSGATPAFITHYDFNSGLPTNTVVYGSASVASNFLQLNPSSGGSGTFQTADLAFGSPVNEFIVDFKVRMIPNGGSYADGFSFNWASDLPNGLGDEEGQGSGLSVTFNTYHGDGVGFRLRWGGNIIAQYGTNNAFLPGPAGDFAPVSIHLYPDGKVDVSYRNVPIFVQVTIPDFTPLAGARFSLASRTGGFSETHDIDDLSLQLFLPGDFSPVAVSVSNTVAELGAVFNPEGTNSAAWFEWGFGTNLNQQTPAISVGDGNSDVPLFASISNIVPGLLYRCRLVVSNAAGLQANNGVVFGSPAITLNSGPIALTDYASLYVEAGATAVTEGLANSPVAIVGTVDTFQSGAQVLTYWSTNNLGGIGNATRTVVVLTNDPPNPPPIVAPASVLASNTVAIVTTTINSANSPTTAWFEWGLSTNYSARTAPLDMGSDGAPVSFNAQVPVTPGLVYQGRVVALHADGGIAFRTVTFGTPQLFLNGPALITNEFGFAYVEAAAVVSAPLAIAAGARHSVAVRGNGTVAAWGDSSLGQTNVPAHATNVVMVAGGGYHNLAVRGDGTVIAWGWNSAGQTIVPASLSNATSVAAGEEHSLALRANGSVVAWGNNSFGQATVPNGLSNVIAVAASANHSLALRADGTVVAWGLNNYGQTNVPVGLSNVIAIEAGGATSLALQANGTVVSWGLGFFGATPGGAIAIAAGNSHGLALLPSGSVSGWGENNYGQRTPPSDLTNALKIATGYDHNLALRQDGTLVAWGRNSHGQTNIPARIVTVLPHVSGSVNPNVSGTYVLTYTYTNALGGFSMVTRTVVVPLAIPTVVALAATGVSNHVAALNATVNPNNVPTTAWFEWGLFSSRLTERTVPVSVGDGSDAVTLSANLTTLIPGATYFGRVVATNTSRATRSDLFVFGSPGITLNGPAQATYEVGTAYIEAGATAYEAPRAIVDTSFHSLLLKRDGTLRAWGNNYHGQLSIPAAPLFSAISANSIQDVALTTDGTVLGWGGNSLNLPPVPAGLAGAKAVAAGFGHNLALLSDGTVVGWGYDNLVAPANLANVVAIAAGSYHNLAVRADCTVVAWGGNASGQLNVPPNLTNVVAVSGGGFHSLALRADGTVVAWGQVSTVPANLSNVVAISAGGYHNLALRADGTVVAWGTGEYGVTNVPPDLANVVAISASITHNLVMQTDGTLVEWGTNTAPFEVNRTPPADYRTITAPISISGSVNPNVVGTYVIHYTVTNSVGAIGTATRTVKIVDPPPIVQTLAARTTNTIATLNALVNPRNLPTTAWFEWGQISGYYPNQTTSALVGSTNNDTAFTANLSGLTPGEVYRGRVVASHADGGTAHGAEVLFGAPSVTLNGLAFVTNELGAAYVEAGAAALNAPRAISGGYLHNLAVRANGTVVGWGNNSEGQLSSPTGLDGVTKISAGFLHSLAMREDGTVVGWGNNQYGQRLIPNDLIASGISAGYTLSTVLRTNGTVFTAADSSFAPFIFTNYPSGLSNVTAVASSAFHTVALRRDGTVVAWGMDGTTTPVKVPAHLDQVRAISAGYYHNVALRENGTVVVWGNSSVVSTDVPVGLSNVVLVAAGGLHTLALRTDGTVVAWGANTKGQTNVPVGLSNVVAVSANAEGSVALQSDGSIVAWGASASNMPPDLSTLPVTITGSVNTNAPGTYQLAYTSTNNFGGISQTTRTVFVTTAGGVSSVQWNGVTRLADGSLRLSFNNTPGAPFTVLASTNIALPVFEWENLGSPIEMSPGHYEFTDLQVTNRPQLFYLIRSP